MSLLLASKTHRKWLKNFKGQTMLEKRKYTCSESKGKFSSLVFHGCSLKSKTELCKDCKDFELVFSRQICERNHVLNYDSGNRLSTKQCPIKKLVLIKVSVI